MDTISPIFPSPEDEERTRPNISNVYSRSLGPLRRKRKARTTRRTLPAGVFHAFAMVACPPNQMVAEVGLVAAVSVLGLGRW